MLKMTNKRFKATAFCFKFTESGNEGCFLLGCQMTSQAFVTESMETGDENSDSLLMVCTTLT